MAPGHPGRYHVLVLVRRMGTVVSVTSAVAALLLLPAVVHAAPAAAEPCPQAQVVFARGAREPAGAGRVGDAFVTALRGKTDKDVGLYAVQYSADVDFVPGANDMSGHIQYMAANCPDTRLVLGGYSLGAAVIDILLGVPSPMLGYTNVLPLGMDDHVAAVALFGNGTRKVLGPVSDINPLWGDKTIDLCTADDPLCNNNMDSNTWLDNWPSHFQAAYIDSGLVDEAAAFVAARL